VGFTSSTSLASRLRLARLLIKQVERLVDQGAIRVLRIDVLGGSPEDSERPGSGTRREFPRKKAVHRSGED